MEAIISIMGIIVSALGISIVMLNNKINKIEHNTVSKDMFYQFEKRFDLICEKLDKLYDKIEEIEKAYKWDGITERRKHG